ncbi:hypothetical protein ABZ756_01970 [Mammaliicoccus sciuri]|uniref:hypothetical protein n=1 Tax=Sporosarcina sp. FSL K6-3508 TaxID=2921557 RepID=UPI003159E724
MRMIPEEAIPYFENVIYLPMIMTILSSDRERFEKLPLKFNGPYINFINEVMTAVQTDMKNTHDYLSKNRMKLIKGKTEGIFTEYIFIHNGYEDSRNYLSYRLRNRTEELMKEYFSKVRN